MLAFLRCLQETKEPFRLKEVASGPSFNDLLNPSFACCLQQIQLSAVCTLRCLRNYVFSYSAAVGAASSESCRVVKACVLSSVPRWIWLVYSLINKVLIAGRFGFSCQQSGLWRSFAF